VKEETKSDEQRTDQGDRYAGDRQVAACLASPAAPQMLQSHLKRRGAVRGGRSYHGHR
jgi:hypothetical protein